MVIVGLPNYITVESQDRGLQFLSASADQSGMRRHLLLLLAILTAEPCYPSVAGFRFSGAVTWLNDTAGLTGGQVALGARVTGEFTYDADSPNTCTAALGCFIDTSPTCQPTIRPAPFWSSCTPPAEKRWTLHMIPCLAECMYSYRTARATPRSSRN